MKILYLDCSMGAAGDMLTAALLELLPNPDEFLQELNALGIPGVVYEKKTEVKNGISGTRVSVSVHGQEEESQDHMHEHEGDHHHDNAHGHSHSHEHGHDHGHENGHDHNHDHEGDHSHNSLRDIEHIVRGHLPVSEKIKDDIMAVYQIIAEAESTVHGVPVTEIHFHEVGTMDAVADITAVAMLMDRLAPKRVVASPVHVGSGQVKCAHGILPVPAPATALILQDVPIYGGRIRGELCTPTGAALLKHYVHHFGDMPIMKTLAIGYGCGKKDFEAANCVRAMLGEAADNSDMIVELSCNIDDMSAEAIGFAMEMLFEGGALDVYTIPIGMKKSRPATQLRIMCREAKRDEMIALIFKHTTTLGIREETLNRHTLARESKLLETSLGAVRKKTAQGYGTERYKYEYEDIANIARKHNLSLEDVLSRLEKNESNTQ